MNEYKSRGLNSVSRKLRSSKHNTSYVLHFTPLCLFKGYFDFLSRPKSKLQYSDDYTEERDSGLESLQLSFTMLDSPEAILKQRISELEKMETTPKAAGLYFYRNTITVNYNTSDAS